MARLNHLTERGYETQRMLGGVLFDLIAEKEYDKISIKDLTERAGIDRTTFYLHFKDKDDLFLKTQRQLLDDWIAFGKNSDRPYPLATLAFEHMAQHPRAYQALLRMDGNALFLSQLQEFLEDSWQPWLREISPKADLPLLAGFVLGALRGLASWWLQANMPYPPEAMGRMYVELVRSGVTGAQWE